MKILTVSASPYVLGRLGRINNGLLQRLSKQHNVASACWHLDTSYYLADENKQFYFELNGSNVCRLYPISDKTEVAAKQLYDAIKDFGPDLVLSIGDYYETNYISLIKEKYPDLFKWVSIFTGDDSSIDQSYWNQIIEVDEAIATNSQHLKQLSRIPGLPIKMRLVGVDVDKFFCDDIRSDIFTISANLKNSQLSNIPAFLQKLKGEKYSL